MHVKSSIVILKGRCLLFLEPRSLIFVLWVENILEEIVDKGISLTVDSLIFLLFFVVLDLYLIVVDIVV